ncbi:MAG: ABC transporter permease [Candidatus Riflebacteria bacterium]|nr:ABC transporter permease [Candidatus Riflebacteria bacterium]
MSALLVIARNVVREAIRRKLLYLIILFALSLLLLAEGVARFETQVQAKMVKDFSYTIISLFGLVIVLLSTFDQVPLEVESKTIYLVLCRPVARQTFLLGKFLGILGVLAIVMIVMGGMLLGMVGLTASKHLTFDTQVAQMLYLLTLKYASFAGLLILLSIVCSRTLAISMSLLVYMYGHVSEFLHASFDTGSMTLLSRFLSVLDFFLPNYTVMDFPSGLVRAELFTTQSLAILTAYSLSFTALYLMLAAWLLAARDL